MEMQYDETVRSNGRRMETQSCIFDPGSNLSTSACASVGLLGHVDAVAWVLFIQSLKLEAGCQKYDRESFSTSTISVRTEPQ
jgi:hypothetical protein